MDSDRIEISVAAQRLTLWRAGRREREYAVSTAARGTGCAQGSFCTPLGRHRIKLKIGAGCPPGAVFVARRPTGEVFDQALGAAHPGRDWILTRILWLQGLEAGVNRGAGVDTLRRYIYIHGTADEDRIGAPASHGCIRMRNADVADLFERVANGTLVSIA